MLFGIFKQKNLILKKDSNIIKICVCTNIQDGVKIKVKKYRITGMSCAACSASVEKAAKSVGGIEKCAVSLLTEAMTVDGDYSEEALFSAIVKAGYGIEEYNGDFISVAETEKVDVSTMALKARLFSSLALLLILMYCAMGHNMAGFPLPLFLVKQPIYIALIQLVLSAVILVINKSFFVNGFRSLLKGSPNMDTLVALGSSVSFVYSIGVTVEMAFDKGRAAELLMGLYYESAAMILVLITVGKLLEARSKGKTADALKSLIKLAPQTATLLVDGKEVTLPVKQVKVGDLFVVRSGESIAVDGVVTEGESTVNESALTGESMPIEKGVGDPVSSGTINMAGYLVCRATRVGEDTTLAKIIKTVSDASATKAPIARIADKVSGIFVPAVISIALITVAVWLLLGKGIEFALVRGISVLVISCPCSLGLATPVAIMVGNGVGAREGILFKNAEALENIGRIKILALDKTGTVTKGEPTVTDVIPFGDTKNDELVSYAYSLEKRSEHPLARAVVAYSEEKGIELFDVSELKIVAGNGLYAKIGERNVIGGSKRYVGQMTGAEVDPDMISDRLADEGKTPLFFAVDGRAIGIIAVADTVKPDSREAIDEFKKMGITTVMLTGDNERTANAVGRQTGVDRIIAGVLPEEKAKQVKALSGNGKVAMIGDGINDSPALVSADVGVAIGAGTDVAIDSADVVLMKSSLIDGVNAIKIGRATLRNIKENLFWAFIYNLVGIPIAAGVFIDLFGWKLTPMLGAAAMSLSSFCVVSNALRLNLFKPFRREGFVSSDKPDLVFHIKGMMCEHCEASVKKALMSVEGVANANADHKKGIAEVTLSANVDVEMLKRAVEAEDYKVKRIVNNRENNEKGAINK